MGFLRYLLKAYFKKKCSLANLNYTIRNQTGLFLEELLPSIALLRLIRNFKAKTIKQKVAGKLSTMKP
jgi:hypothetical protein